MLNSVTVPSSLDPDTKAIHALTCKVFPLQSWDRLRAGQRAAVISSDILKALTVLDSGPSPDHWLHKLINEATIYVENLLETGTFL